MSTSTTTGYPVIAAWSAVSPFGMGKAEFRTGLRAGRSAAAPLDPASWPVPSLEACLVPGLDIREALGRKGTRSMDRVTGLAVTAVGRLLADWPTPIGGDGAETALVLGTTTGSAQSIMDFTRDSLVQQMPYHVDPARFPNTVMNCAAGQCAIWYQLRGPNVTIAAGRASGLQALNYARRLHRSGRVSEVLCGAAEEFSAARAWLEWHARDGAAPAVLGEGCAMLLLRHPDAAHADDGTGGLADVLGIEFGVYGPDGDCRAVIARCVRRVLDRAGVAPQDVWVVSPSQLPGPLGEQEEAALDGVFAGERPVRVGCADLIGETSAASAAFQVVAVLAVAEDEPAACGRVALVTSVDWDGVVGCTLLRLH